MGSWECSYKLSRADPALVKCSVMLLLTSAGLWQLSWCWVLRFADVWPFSKQDFFLSPPATCSVPKCKFCTVAPLCLSSSLCPYSSADQDGSGSVRLLIFFVFELFFHHKAAGTALLGIDFWQHHKRNGGVVFCWAPALQSCTSASPSCQSGERVKAAPIEELIKTWPWIYQLGSLDL